MSSILETVMMVCFGLSWPINLMKAYRAGTTKGTSLFFILLIELGYAAGIAAKLVGGQITYVLAVYVFNFVMVTGNLLVYIRNRNLDKAREGK
ncbi:MAG: hypothetical protein IJ048_13875 [Clostridia bacterium]|nr:hypothetical protein [Clostridia bacterium]